MHFDEKAIKKAAQKILDNELQDAQLAETIAKAIAAAFTEYVNQQRQS